MLSRFTHNWTLKITSLVLAVAVWSHVRGQVNPWETMTFKARLKTTAPRGFLVLNSGELPKTVVVTLRGPRLTLRGLKGPAPANPLATTEDAPLLPGSQLWATLEFSNPRKGAQNVAVKAEADIEDIEVVGAKPAEIAVTLDAQESRRFEIKPQIPGSDEVEIEDVKLSVKQARIFGPSKLLDQVKSVRARVDSGDLKTGVLRLPRVPLEAVNAQGEAIEGIPIEPQFVKIEIKAREKQSEKSVRLSVKTSGSPNADYELGSIEIEPERLAVRGPQRALESINSLTVEVDISGADSNINRRIRVQLPGKIEAVDSSRVRVRVEFKPRKQSTPAATPTPPPPQELPPPVNPLVN